MLIVYSYSGPYGAPDGQGGVLAYPGEGQRKTWMHSEVHREQHIAVQLLYTGK
jgi:hypothetical protein